MVLESVAARLKAFREAKGLTKYRLAKLSTEYAKKYGGRGISQTYIYRIEKGEIKNPRRDTLQVLARALNITLAQLIDETAPSDTWHLVEQSLKAYIPVYAGVYEVGMEPIDHVVCTREKIAPETLRGYRWDGLHLEPEILPGDTVIVDAGISPKSGDLVMVTQPEGRFGTRQAAIRRYRQGEDGVGIVESNEGVCELNELGCCVTDGMCLYGVVTELVRKLR